MGQGGDGRWPLKWNIIECPRSQLRFESQGSHQYYGKLKASGGPSGIDRMVCNGEEWTPTPDAYFVKQDKDGKLCEGVTCDIYFTNGSTRRESVPGNVFC